MMKDGERGWRRSSCASSAQTAKRDVVAQAVIDASGTIDTPNPLGANGLPAMGERALADRIFYGIPDVLGPARTRYAGKRVLVSGSGHSAFNALLDLAALAEQDAGYGDYLGGAARRYAASSSAAARTISSRSGARWASGCAAGGDRPGADGDRLQDRRLTATADGIVVGDGDEVAGAGRRDHRDHRLPARLAMLHELRLGLDPAVEARPRSRR